MALIRVVWVRMALIRVVWGQLSDEWIQVRVTWQGQMVCHEWFWSRVVPHDSGFGSGWSLMTVVLDQGGPSWQWFWIRVVPHECFWIWVVPHDSAFGSRWSLMTVLLDQGVLLDSGCGSGWSLMTVAVGQDGPSWQWLRVRVVPHENGSGSRWSSRELFWTQSLRVDSGHSGWIVLDQCFPYAWTACIIFSILPSKHFPHLHNPLILPPFSPSLISLTVSVDVKHHVYLLTYFSYLLPTLNAKWLLPHPMDCPNSSCPSHGLSPSQEPFVNWQLPHLTDYLNDCPISRTEHFAKLLSQQYYLSINTCIKWPSASKLWMHK